MVIFVDTLLQVHKRLTIGQNHSAVCTNEGGIETHSRTIVLSMLLVAHA